ncbi:MAG: aminoacyl-tRNA hydrolase [Deltaproteobacteria bacterium]|nr:aminoacyl-tRNA hydrolase [Deltaproteobacteria bacterium]
MEIGGLFLGLGNPGPAYARTRHNFGFMTAEALLDACRRGGDVTALSGGKKRFEAWKCRLPIPSRETWIIAKPQTFMNKSGDAAVALLQYYRIPFSRLVVAHDELDLPLGRMRFKIGGGAAGHNGVRSIAESLGSPEFYRLRLGIGKPQGYEVTSYVLGRFSEPEIKIAGDVIPAAVEGFFRFREYGFTDAQQYVNGFTSSCT